MKNKCLRCGRCCIVKSVSGNWLDCRYLVRDSVGFCTCIIYRKRFRKRSNGFICHKRIDVQYNFPNCSFNRKGLNIHPAYKKAHGEERLTKEIR